MGLSVGRIKHLYRFLYTELSEGSAVGLLVSLVYYGLGTPIGVDACLYGGFYGILVSRNNTQYKQYE